MIRIGSIDWGPDEREAVIDLISGDDPQLTFGKLCAKFEREFSRWCGRRYGVLVNSGSSACLLSLLAVKISEGIGDGAKVATAPLTYPATWWAIVNAGLTPVYVDTEPNSVNMDVLRIPLREVEMAFPVHLFGKPVHGLDHLDVPVSEDACQAHGSEIGGKRVGAMGDIAAFSFSPAHTVTTIEGGIVVTDQRKLAEICRSLRDNSRICTCQVCALKVGKSCPKRREFEAAAKAGTHHTSELRWVTNPYPGYNMKPYEIMGALGLVKMGKIDHIVERRHEIFRMYNEELGGISPLHEERGELVVPIIYPVAVDDPKPVMRSLEKAKIEYRAMYPYRGECPNAASMSERGISIPSHQDLSDEDISLIISTIKKAVQ